MRNFGRRKKSKKKSPTGTAGLINARQELTHSTHEPILMGFDELKGSEKEKETVIEKS